MTRIVEHRSALPFGPVVEVHVRHDVDGGERSGPPGRGAEGKTPFVTAVETTEDDKPHRIILRRVKSGPFPDVRL